MWYLPKDYVWVHERVQKAHDKYWDKLNIETEFDIKDRVVIFKAKVRIWDQVFTGSSFWEVGKEKAFEKLETVAVWRALAFAWFEIKSWIASKDEMEVWENKKVENTTRLNVMDYVERVRDEIDVNALAVIYKEFKAQNPTQKQEDWLVREIKERKAKLLEEQQ